MRNGDDIRSVKNAGSRTIGKAPYCGAFFITLEPRGVVLPEVLVDRSGNVLILLNEVEMALDESADLVKAAVVHEGIGLVVVIILWLILRCILLIPSRLILVKIGVGRSGSKQNGAGKQGD